MPKSAKGQWVKIGTQDGTLVHGPNTKQPAVCPASLISSHTQIRISRLGTVEESFPSTLATPPPSKPPPPRLGRWRIASALRSQAEDWWQLGGFREDLVWFRVNRHFANVLTQPKGPRNPSSLVETTKYLGLVGTLINLLQI